MGDIGNFGGIGNFGYPGGLPGGQKPLLAYGADVGVGDRLFHTLDPTTRTLRAIGEHPAGRLG